MRATRSTRRRLSIGAVLAAVLAVASLVPAGASDARGAPLELHVVVEPGATMSFLDAAILHATRSVRVEIYELADPTVEADLANRAAHHVAVYVLVDRAYAGRSANAPAVAWLRAHHVQVRWANASAIFHEKAVVLDATTAYVGTGNLQAKYYATTRDFWLKDTDRADVAAIDATFDVDWTGAAPTTAPGGADLVWSPGSEATFLAAIARAKHSIALESEEMDADKVVNALIDAARRGVVVHVTMTYDSSWVWAFKELTAGGVAVHLYYGETPLYIHAKAICIDCSLGAHPSGTLLVGSQNLSTSSLQYNRELSIKTRAPSVVAAIDRVLRSDFAGGAAY